MIEHLNTLITAKVALRPQTAEATTRVNKPLIEMIRDYYNIHDIDHREMSRKQIERTSKYCKTIKP